MLWPDEAMPRPVAAAIAPVAAEVWRGEILESVHRASAAEADASGAVLWALGFPDMMAAFRSAAKPLQAIPLATLPGARDLGLTEEEMAICCASHPGEPRHAALAASVLALSGCPPDDLVCGPAGNPPSPLRHGCSGNHAGLLVAARLLGASLAGYEQPGHPVQVRVRALIQELAGARELREAVDGCGIPTWGLTLAQMARAFAALTAPEAPWARIPRAMALHPELVGPRDRADVRVMQATGGRVAAKTGAEGLLCLGLMQEGRGMAVKVEDGSPRPLPALAAALLARSGWIGTEEAERIAAPDDDAACGPRAPRIRVPDLEALVQAAPMPV